MRKWRQPTPYESVLLRVLCSLDFPEHEIYAEQAQYCEVVEIDEEKQLGFRIPEEIRRASSWATAVAEARFYQDRDWASFLLHVRDGQLLELEKFVPNPTVTIHNWEPPLSELQWYTFARGIAVAVDAPSGNP